MASIASVEKYKIKMSDGSVLPTKEAARDAGIRPNFRLRRIWDKLEEKK